MKRFLAFWTLVYLWSVEMLYHVLIGLCWFHQGPSFVFWTLISLFLSLHPLSRRPLCTNGFFSSSQGSHWHSCLISSAAEQKQFTLSNTPLLATSETLSSGYHMGREDPPLEEKTGLPLLALAIPPFERMKPLFFKQDALLKNF